MQSKLIQINGLTGWKLLSIARKVWCKNRIFGHNTLFCVVPHGHVVVEGVGVFVA